MNGIKTTEKQIQHHSERPFLEGIYTIRHPLAVLAKATLHIKYNKKGNKVKGEIHCFRRVEVLHVIKFREEHLVFKLRIDIIDIDLVIDFYKRDAFKGFFDTPIGHFYFTGRHKRNSE